MKKNYFKSLGLLFVSLFVSMAVNAGELIYPADNVIYEKVSDTDVKVVGYVKGFSAEDFTFTSTVQYGDNTYNVVAIDKFIDNTKIKHITIQGGIKGITLNWQGFKGATNLESVTFESGVTKLAKGCFQNCPALTSVVLPEGVTEIPGYAFQGCTSLKEIVLPASVTNIATDAFVGCTALEKIVCCSTTPPTIATSTAFLDNNVTLGCPESALDAYDAAYGDKFGYVEADSRATAVATGVSAVAVAKANVAVNGKAIAVANAKGEVAVYSAAGAQVAKVVANGNDVELAVSAAGVYLVKVNGETVKVLVK